LSKDWQFFVYIVASKSRVLYVGMTNDLIERTRQHRFGLVEGFTSKYRCTRLVHLERFQYADNCINREKELKSWTRRKEVELIEASNPTWEDLSADWFLEDRSLNVESRSLAALCRTNWKNDKTFAAVIQGRDSY
jgi:putative endonuclease